jgi:hypothetical protein
VVRGFGVLSWFATDSFFFFFFEPSFFFPILRLTRRLAGTATYYSFDNNGGPGPSEAADGVGQ